MHKQIETERLQATESINHLDLILELRQTERDCKQQNPQSLHARVCVLLLMQTEIFSRQNLEQEGKGQGGGADLVPT